MSNCWAIMPFFTNRMKKVAIYSTPTCHYCHAAKDFFAEKGIKYTEYDVMSDLVRRQEMVEKTDQMGVPVIMVDDEYVVGFDQALLEDLLGLKK